jgi:3-deoxy-D-manno-octulosonic-acid transferase
MASSARTPRLKAMLAREAYSLLLRALMPAYLGRLWWRGRREPGYRLAWRERLGHGAGAAGPGRLWIHAVSLGETRAAAALIEALRRARPGIRLLLTHGTATGREAGARLLREGDLQAWLPYDTPGAVARFLDHHRPVAGVLLETEVWPNLMREARRRGVPMVLANARLSERSLAKARRMAALMRPAVAALSSVLAQTEDDARRLRAAGADAVAVFGNLKFDVTPDSHAVARGLAWRRHLTRPVVMAASTREGEEGPLLDAWLSQPSPRPLLLLVPRHPQRFDEVAQMVERAGLSCVRRSAWRGAPPPEAAEADVWLGDSVGEMPVFYGMADVALLGGSFARLGGQNLIEAAACGCPVVMGPHTFNFAEASRLAADAGAALRVRDIDEGVARAVALARDPAHAQRVEQALAFTAAHRGAADRMAVAIGAFLDAPRRC